jgi:hypothetical protein
MLDGRTLLKPFGIVKTRLLLLGFRRDEQMKEGSTYWKKMKGQNNRRRKNLGLRHSLYSRVET